MNLSLKTISEGEILKKIEAVIFDWAGTIVDFGSVAPVDALKQTFDCFDIEVSLEQIRESMGKNKREHIKDILSMEPNKEQWMNLHKRKWNESDISAIYTEFQRELIKILEKDTTHIEGVPELFQTLRRSGIKVGSSTGYSSEMLQPILKSIQKDELKPDYIVTADEVESGRPSPEMINQNMALMKINDPKLIINVGDTHVDIETGKNAGVHTVGVVIGSSEMGLSKEEFDFLDKSEKENVINATIKKFEKAGADHIVRNIGDVADLITTVEGNNP